MNINLDNAKEVEANWFKFNKVGDGIKGTLTNKTYNEGQDNYSDQWIYEIRTEEGEVWNVPVSVNKKGTVQRLNNCAIGEIIAIVFDKEGESPKKGFAKPKYYKVYSFGIDPNFTNDNDEGEIDVKGIEL